MPTPLAKPPGSWTIGTILLLAVVGCAYYNTFYLAKRYYREGQKAQERALTDTPPPDAVQKYDATIRQCAKILVDYPKSKWMDDAIYLMGAAMYGKGDYVGAIKKFGELRENAPKSPFVPDSKLMEALSQLKRKEYREAEVLFLEVEKQYPSLDRKWELYFHMGECEAQLREYGQAVSSYERAARAARRWRERADALRRMADAHMAAKQFQEAEVAYAEALKVEERGGKRLDIALSRGEAFRELARYPEALSLYESWRPFAAAEKREGEVSLRIFECMAQTGRVQDAIEGFRKLVELYPHSNVAYEAQFRIGYLYESQVGDLDAAGREYEKLKAEPQSQFQSQAARRAQSLATLKQYRQTLLSDTTQAKPRAAFLLAELYYFQLEKLDSALIQYSGVEHEFPSSPYAPKAAFARLWIHTHDQSDTSAAAALTDSIVARYSRSRYAESALYLWKRWSGRTDERTARFDSMIANPDTSLMRERLAERELLEPTVPVAPQAQDTTRARPGAVYEITPAERARLDSLATYTHNLDRAKQGLPPPPPPDTTSARSPADTVSAPTIGPSR